MFSQQKCILIEPNHYRKPISHKSKIKWKKALKCIEDHCRQQKAVKKRAVKRNQQQKVLKC